MNLSELSKWLRRTPQPVIVVADTKRIDVGTKGGKWGEIARTIESIGATKLECLDGAGNIIRAKTLSDGAEEDEKKTELQSDLHALSKIIAEAYEKGTKAPAQLLESAMTFIERQGNRLVAQDREIERLRAINGKLSAEILALKALPGEEGDESGIMGALMQGVLQASQSAEPTPPNGKKGGS